MELANALYFPYIKIQNSAWLKTAALYYSRLLRIVPLGIDLRDDDTARALIDECGFIENIDAAHEAEMIAMDFVHEMRASSSWPQTLPTIFRKRRDFSSVNGPVKIHVSKFTYATLGALAEMGLAEDYRRLTARQRWIKVEPRAAAIYMTMLAERMAARRGIATVTDDPLFQKWIRYFGFETREERQDGAAFRLPEFVIRAAVPRGVEQIPIAKIIEFRRKHEAERLRFFEAVRLMSQDIVAIQEQTALEDCLRQHEVAVADAEEQLKKALRGLQIESIAGLLGVSLPPLLPQLVQTPSGALIAGGISLAVGIKTLGYWQQYTHLRDGSPWTYVLSLSRLGARGFLESIALDELFV